MKGHLRARDGMLYAILFILLILLDQVTKEYFSTKRAVFEFGWVTLHLVTNAGASFGTLQDFGTALLVLSVAALAVIAWYFLRASGIERVSLVFIAAGIMGNLLNRVAYGFVIDWIDLSWWPVFNVADSCICIGVFALAIALVAKERKGRTDAKQRKHTGKKK